MTESEVLPKAAELVERADLKPLRGKKRLMYEALRGALGNLSSACKRVNIGRSTHYGWLKEDPNYSLWCESIKDMRIDFYEHALDKLVEEGNVTAVTFGLKTIGKKRGYAEVKHVKHEGQVDIAHRLLQELGNDD